MPKLLNNCINFAQSLMPTCCRCCGVKATAALCPACWQATPWRESGCLRCAKPLSSGYECGECSKHPCPLEHVVAATHYRDIARQLVLGFKHQSRPADVRLITQLMLSQYKVSPVTFPAGAIYMPVPLHPSRIRWRGYNQAALLARELARRVGGRYWASGVIKQKETPSQQGLNRAGRLQNLEAAFVLNPRYVFEGQQVIIVDDVMTTGATLESIATLLKATNVAGVSAWVFARADE